MRLIIRIISVTCGIGLLCSALNAQTKIAPPAQWRHNENYVSTFPDEDLWWKYFNDPTLDSLISLGVKNNYNLLAASRRIKIASEGLRRVKAGYYPTINVSAGAIVSRQSGNMTRSSISAVTNNYISAGLNASWEIDLFGRITSKAKQQKGVFNASRAEYASAMVSMCSQIAQTYIAMRTAEVQLEIAKRHLEMQKAVMHITEVRYETGLSSKLDVAQAASVYYSTEATIPSLETTVSIAKNALVVLTGVLSDDCIDWDSGKNTIPQYNGPIAIGVPIDVLRRRPDIAEAEFNLASAAAAVGIAKKDFLPTVSIQGSIGFDAHRLGDLFKKLSLGYSIAPTLSWTMFEGFSRNANLASARESMIMAIDEYNLTVSTAIEEVENALVTHYNASRTLKSLELVVKSSQEAFDKSLDLYKQGLTSFTSVADAQINLFEYSSQYAAEEGEISKSLISIYSSLGGGWDGR